VVTATRVAMPVYESDSKRDLKFSALDFNQSIGDADAILRREVGAWKYDVFNTRQQVTPEKLKSAFSAYVASEYKAFKDLSDKVQAAKTMYGEDVVRREMKAIFKDNSVRKAYREALLKGEFESKTLKNDFLADMRKKAIEQDPLHEAEITAEFSKRLAALRAFRKDFKTILGEAK
jgi:hypothetical protein